MALCKLTDSQNSGNQVFVNPLHVVAVQRMGNYTWVWTEGARTDGQSVVFVVEESAEEATRLLDQAMPRYV